jgi:secondary thiamine-phosphate synthase enzyme
MRTFEFKTHAKEELVDITSIVREEAESHGVRNGLCVVYVPHTTAGLMINENADPDVRQDILMALRKLVPDSLPYQHIEGNSPGHVKAGITGSSVTVIIENGRLMLGIWQGVFFCEFDGPRERRVYIKVVPA